MRSISEGRTCGEGWAAMIRNSHRRAQVPGLGLALGAAIGVVLGTLIGTLIGGGAQAALGVVIGAALGLLIGAAVQVPWASHRGR